MKNLCKKNTAEVNLPYEAVAKEHNTTPKMVKREMQKSIDDACKKPNSPMLRIPHKGEIPTVDELLDFAVKHFEK